jgi:hypothetical protein
VQKADRSATRSRLVCVLGALGSPLIFLLAWSAMGQEGRRSVPEAGHANLTVQLPGAREDYIDQLAALFDTAGRPCVSVTGLFHTAGKGVRFTIPADRSASVMIGLKRDKEARTVQIELGGADCKYDILISRAEKKDGQWVRTDLLEEPKIDFPQ